MNRKWVVVPALALVMGSMSLAAVQDETNKLTPVISESFASKQIRPGDTWKIYLKASDAKGGMKNIVSYVEQPGVGRYPISITRIKEADQKELGGYLYLNTFGSGNRMNFIHLTLYVQIQDKEGRFSEPAVFPLYIQSRLTQENAPQGVFAEKDLGPVMIQLRSTNEKGQN